MPAPPLDIRICKPYAQAPRVRRPSGQVLQQCCLAHAEVAAHYQRPALAGSDRFGKPVQGAALGTPVGQSCRAAPPPGICGHWPGDPPRRRNNWA